MKRHVKSAKLHTSVFINGINLDQTLNESTKGGLHMVYCYEHQFLEVHLHSKGEDARGVVPIANIASMQFGAHIAPKVEEIEVPAETLARLAAAEASDGPFIKGPIVNPLPPEESQAVLGGPISEIARQQNAGPHYNPTQAVSQAQVSTPQSHVHQGQGKGKR